MLYKKLINLLPGLTSTEIFNSGATKIVGLLPASETSVGLGRISSALTESWYVAVIAACLSGLGALGIGFKKFKIE